MFYTLRDLNILLIIIFVALLFIVSFWVDMIIITIIYFALRKRFGYIPKSKK